MEKNRFQELLLSKKFEISRETVPFRKLGILGKIGTFCLSYFDSKAK
jgi:hypothetical protein